MQKRVTSIKPHVQFYIKNFMGGESMTLVQMMGVWKLTVTTKTCSTCGHFSVLYIVEDIDM